MAKKPIISKHGRTRMKERSGISGNSSEKIAKRAIEHGIEADDTLDELRQWISNRKLDRSSSLYIYAGMAYIFRKNTLITAISIPEEINMCLKAYVKKEAWERYEKYRASLHRNFNEEKSTQKSKFIDTKTVQALVNRFCRENDIPFVVVSVRHQYARNFSVRFISDDPDNDKMYFRKIRQWGESERDIKLTLIHDK